MPDDGNAANNRSPVDDQEPDDLAPKRETTARQMPGGSWVMLGIFVIGMIYLFVSLIFFQD